MIAWRVRKQACSYFTIVIVSVVWTTVNTPLNISERRALERLVQSYLSVKATVPWINMINISHPKIHGKPPVNRTFPAKDIDSKHCEIANETNAYKKVEFEMEKADYNQNIIETTACSFEQLCDIINDLEKNITTEIPEIDRLQVQTKCYEFPSCEFNLFSLL